MARILKLSSSQIDMYRKCPRQWAFRYIEGLRVPPSGAMKLSGVGHTVIEYNYKKKVTTHKDLSESDLGELYEETWKQELDREEVKWAEDDEGEKEKPEAVRDAGIAAVKKFRQHNMPLVMPLSEKSVEEWFDIPLNVKEPCDRHKRLNQEFVVGCEDCKKIEYHLNGKIDVTDINLIIRDNKIVAPQRVPDAIAIAKNSQLTTYALAKRLQTKKPEAGLSLDIAVKPTKTKGARAVTIPTERTREFLIEHLNTIGHVARGIMHESFPRHEDGWWCSEKFCGYWSRCMGKNLTVIDMGDRIKKQLEASLSDV